MTRWPGFWWVEVRMNRILWGIVNELDGIIVQDRIPFALLESVCRLKINPSIFSIDGGQGHAAVNDMRRIVVMRIGTSRIR